MQTEGLFSVELRDHICDYILQLVGSDRRVTSGAIVGSLAQAQGDRWSDLDLTFAVQDETDKVAVLDDLAFRLQTEFRAVTLFDLPSGQTLFRVFLLPGCLQVDVSVSPSSHFGAIGPNFQLLFGEAAHLSTVQPPAPRYLFGYAVHHLVRARFCIERRRLWQAEYWISAARDAALTIACVEKGLPFSFGRGFDSLPLELQDQARASLVASLSRTQLILSLTAVADMLAKQTSPDIEDLTTINLHLKTITSSLGEK